MTNSSKRNVFLAVNGVERAGLGSHDRIDILVHRRSPPSLRYGWAYFPIAKLIPMPRAVQIPSTIEGLGHIHDRERCRFSITGDLKAKKNRTTSIGSDRIFLNSFYVNNVTIPHHSLAKHDLPWIKLWATCFPNVCKVRWEGGASVREARGSASCIPAQSF